MVDAVVCGRFDDLDVLGSVIRLDPVLVVRNLTGLESPTEHQFCD